MKTDKNQYRKKLPSNTLKMSLRTDSIFGSEIKSTACVTIEESSIRMKKSTKDKTVFSAIHKNPETRQLSWEVAVPSLSCREKRNYQFSRHCLQRAAQRGIQADAIAYTLEFGRVYFRQGMFFHVLGKKELPPALRHEWERLRHTVVVLSGDDNTLITAYRADNPFRNIRRKSKVLLTHHQRMAA